MCDPPFLPSRARVRRPLVASKALLWQGYEAGGDAAQPLALPRRALSGVNRSAIASSWPRVSVWLACRTATGRGGAPSCRLRHIVRRRALATEWVLEVETHRTSAAYHGTTWRLTRSSRDRSADWMKPRLGPGLSVEKRLRRAVQLGLSRKGRTDGCSMGLLGQLSNFGRRTSSSRGCNPGRQSMDRG